MKRNALSSTLTVHIIKAWIILWGDSVPWGKHSSYNVDSKARPGGSGKKGKCFKISPLKGEEESLARWAPIQGQMSPRKRGSAPEKNFQEKVRVDLCIREGIARALCSGFFPLCHPRPLTPFCLYVYFAKFRGAFTWAFLRSPPVPPEKFNNELCFLWNIRFSFS